MTTYVLAGGCDRNYPEYGYELSRFVKEFNPNPKILSCFFSWPDNQAEEKYQQWQGWFAKYFGPESNHTLATKDNFIDEVKNHDVIYLHGGNTALLAESMPSATELKAIFQDKIVIGSSAGANFLSSACFSVSKDHPMKGSGLLKLNTLVHYGVLDFEGHHREAQDWVEIQHKLREFADNDFETICLPEGKFTIVTSS